MDNFCCKMSKITKPMKNGLQLWVQKVTWAGTQCSEFSPQARLILCQYMDNFAALVLNCFYILIRIAWTSLFHCSHDFMPVLYVWLAHTHTHKATNYCLCSCVSACACANVQARYVSIHQGCHCGFPLFVLRPEEDS